MVNVEHVLPLQDPYNPKGKKYVSVQENVKSNYWKKLTKVEKSIIGIGKQSLRYFLGQRLSWSLWGWINSEVWKEWRQEQRNHEKKSWENMKQTFMKYRTTSKGGQLIFKLPKYFLSVPLFLWIEKKTTAEQKCSVAVGRRI